MAMYGTEPVMRQATGGGMGPAGGSPLMRILASLAPQVAASESGPDFSALARARRLGGGMMPPPMQNPMSPAAGAPPMAGGSVTPFVMGGSGRY